MLALRNPLDAAATATAGTRTGSLFVGERDACRRAAAPARPKRRRGRAAPVAAPIAPPALPPPPYVVEAIRAAKRSTEAVLR